ncbi:histone-specific N-acetyltransferase, putative [Candida dubliniensis CD36]|uniref:N-alpha-acetyltransferase 40 n=1 Tax=Candida dubliniensis (strain CD36 / ATCC MYA-646 / CBS 7987 / NCPF 3949 / NRRL Y-17841) TaxID=573826 RepID=B9WFI7_CANDC|nr:histone-specific N-acetyltransferase, putative [Candida dubliniensis CD36]CAX42006.1 histone-specific N-acetyltransferase, putative [Candida dubliniensis CD36]
MRVRFELNGQKYNKFSEDDPFLMEEIAEDLVLNHLTTNTFSLPNYRTHIETTHNIQENQLHDFIQLIDDNLGDLYVKSQEQNWKDNKQEEMSEPGLIYVWFTETTTDDDDELVGFVSFKLCEDDDGIFVLYLFEIHLTEKYQGQKLGQLLIDQFHEFAKSLQNSSNKLYSMLEGTALTVFTKNTKALNWYKKMNYELTERSPMDKKLRNGTVIKPVLYLMRRKL